MNRTETINNEGVKTIYFDSNQKFVIYPLSQTLKEKAVNYLKTELHPDVLKEIKYAYDENGESWISGHHLFFGMGIRNLLRNIIKDNELPKNIWNDTEGNQNWDDYYVLVLEIAAEIKPIEAND